MDTAGVNDAVIATDVAVALLVVDSIVEPVVASIVDLEDEVETAELIDALDDCKVTMGVVVPVVLAILVMASVALAADPVEVAVGNAMVVSVVVPIVLAMPLMASVVLATGPVEVAVGNAVVVSFMVRFAVALTVVLRVAEMVILKVSTTRGSSAIGPPMVHHLSRSSTDACCSL